MYTPVDPNFTIYICICYDERSTLCGHVSMMTEQPNVSLPFALGWVSCRYRNGEKKEENIQPLTRLSDLHLCCSHMPFNKYRPSVSFHGVQRRMVLVDNFFEFFKLLFFVLLLIFAT